MRVKAIMQTKVLHISPYATLMEAAEKLLVNRIDTLLVLKGDKLLGINGLRDLFTAPIPAHYGNPMTRHDNGQQLLSIWKTMTIQDLMNEKVVTVRDEASLLRAAQLMDKSRKYSLPVLRDGEVVGVVSYSDIARALVGKA